MDRGRTSGAAAAAAAAVALAVAPAGPALSEAELIVNGSFESPDIATGTFAIFPTIPGWTHQPRTGTTSAGFELQDHVSGAPAPGAGDQFLEVDSTGPSEVHQDVATSPGSTYRLQLLWSPRPGTAAAENALRLSAGTASATLGPLAGGATTSWRTASLDVVADSDTTRIAILDLGPEQAQGGVGAYVDAVSFVLVNTPPDCSAVTASPAVLWPPDHALRTITLAGATDADGDPVTLEVTSVTQDEPVDGSGDGRTAPDAVPGTSSGTVQLRAERTGGSDGRVYRVSHVASDGQGGTCSGTVDVAVPHDRHSDAVDSGGAHDSFDAGA